MTNRACTGKKKKKKEVNTALKKEISTGRPIAMWFKYLHSNTSVGEVTKITQLPSMDYLIRVCRYKENNGPSSMLRPASTIKLRPSYYMQSG